MRSFYTTLILIPLALSTASPPPVPILHDSADLAYMPHNTLFMRQVSDLQTFEGALGGIKAQPITASGNTKMPFSACGQMFADFGTASQRTCNVQFNSCADMANGAGDGNANSNGNTNSNSNSNSAGSGSRSGTGSGSASGNAAANKGAPASPSLKPRVSAKPLSAKPAEASAKPAAASAKAEASAKPTSASGAKAAPNANNKAVDASPSSSPSVGTNGALTVQSCDEQRTQCYAAQNAAPIKDFSSATTSMNIGPDPMFPDYDLICDM